MYHPNWQITALTSIIAKHGETQAEQQAEYFLLGKKKKCLFI